MNGGIWIVHLLRIGGIVIILDQLTKWLVVKNMELGEKISIADPYLGFFPTAIGERLGECLKGRCGYFISSQLSLSLVLFISSIKKRKGKPFFRLSLMFLLGGAIGNFIDRLWRKEVVDFVDVIIPVINYDFPIFNVADAALTIGVIMIIIHIIWMKKE